MGLAQKLLVGHHHDHDSGGVITHPRAYELFANVWYLGQRARIWDRLVAASGAQAGEKVLDVGCRHSQQRNGLSRRSIASPAETGGICRNAYRADTPQRRAQTSTNA